MPRRASFRVERLVVQVAGYERFVQIDDDGDVKISKTDGSQEVFIPKVMVGGLVGALNFARKPK